MTLQIGQKRVRKRKRVQIHRLEVDAAAGAGRGHEARVKISVVRDYGAVSHELKEHPHGLALVGRAPDVLIGDAGELSYLGGDVNSGVDKGVEALLYLASGEYHGADLSHAVRARVETGGLNVKGHHLVVHIA